ncbi:dehydrogenase [Limnochorda pilosa]|uniref:Dehydrogenase n=1 Tax=Limnochorda pilosa TaxID=1555112 RepID=A0A0K2SL09_LIMPI|nr:dehydrogenase [Limnochorda pilosa]
MRVGVCGLGFIGPAHVEALGRVAGVEVAAVSSHRVGRLREVARRYRIPRVHTSHEALINDPEIDAVHICTGNREHFALARRAMEAGKHVVCEKPLAATLEEGRTLAGLAARAPGRVHAVNYQYRHYPMVAEARTRVRAGELGPLYLIHGRYVQDWLLWPADYNWRVDPARSGPSRAFADIGSHWCDLVEHVTGEHIVRLSARLRTVIPHRVPREAGAFEGTVAPPAGAGRMDDAGRSVAVSTEDLALVHFETDRGTAGSLVVSQVSAGHKNDLRFELNGARASLAWAQETPERLWLGRRDAPNAALTKEAAQLGAEAAALTHYPAGHPEGYPDALKNLFAAVYDRVRDPSRSPSYPTFADGLRSLELVAAVLASAGEGGRWVEVAGNVP